MLMCTQGECEKNGEYMVVAHTLDGVAVPGHCQLSCATCTLQVPSGAYVLLYLRLRVTAQPDTHLHTANTCLWQH